MFGYVKRHPLYSFALSVFVAWIVEKLCPLWKLIEEVKKARA
jgi:hypothetical protein